MVIRSTIKLQPVNRGGDVLTKGVVLNKPYVRHQGKIVEGAFKGVLEKDWRNMCVDVEHHIRRSPLDCSHDGSSPRGVPIAVRRDEVCNTLHVSFCWCVQRIL